MKINFLSAALAVMMLGLFATSCSNDLTEEPGGSRSIAMKLAKTPDINVWSGSQNLYGGTGTRADGNGFDEDYTQSKYMNDDVEVNLSINDVHTNEDGTQKYDATDLISKLSVHIRNGNDVKITIPVPREYYCDQDDLYIFNRHGGDIFVNGGEIEDNKSEVEVKVGTTRKGGSLPSTGGCGCMTDKGCNCDYHDADGNCKCDNMDCNCKKEGGENLLSRGATFTDDELTETVKLTIEFNPNEIVIYTEGLTEGIIEWCKQHFDDGLNFEVYNYYNRSNMPVVDEEGNVTGGAQTATFAEWSLSELKEALDGSTIEFVGCIMSEAPEYYVNAFTGKTISHNGQLEYRDCYVRVIDNQGDWFEYPYFNYYHNGFNMNLIYQNLKLEFEEGEENPAYNHMPDYDDFFGVGKATVAVE